MYRTCTWQTSISRAVQWRGNAWLVAGVRSQSLSGCEASFIPEVVTRVLRPRHVRARLAIARRRLRASKKREHGREQQEDGHVIWYRDLWNWEFWQTDSKRFEGPFWTDAVHHIWHEAPPVYQVMRDCSLCALTSDRNLYSNPNNQNLFAGLQQTAFDDNNRRCWESNDLKVFIICFGVNFYHLFGCFG